MNGCIDGRTGRRTRASASVHREGTQHHGQRLAPRLLVCYHGTIVHTMTTVERVQTGVRLERHLLKVLKAVATYLDLSLGDLLEGIVLHAFEGRAPFSADTLAEIAKLRSVYGLTLTARDSHQLVEDRGPILPPQRGRAARRDAGSREVRRRRMRQGGK